jgi:hypothetical protein
MTLWIAPALGARALFFVFVFVFVGWFAMGMRLNVRKGNAMLRWLREGLPLLGEKTTLRWLGSSAIELKIQNAREPLRQVEIFIVLEPRDIPFLWGYFHWRGRRDILIVRGQASGEPAFQLEAADPRAWSARGVQEDAKRKRWTKLAAPEGLAAYGEGRTDRAAQLLALAAGCDLPLVRLSVRRKAPEIEAQWELRDFEKIPARRVIETFRAIGEAV